MAPNKVVLYRINGRLGNQLFQYAAALAIARRIQGRPLLDPRCKEDNVLEKYLPLELASGSEVEKLVGRSTLFGKIYRKIQPGLPVFLRSFFLEKNQLFDPSLNRISRSCLIDGYWQSFRYFLNLDKSEFAGLTKRIAERAGKDELLNQAENAVAIHVRGTDSLKEYGALPTSYYSDAIARFGPSQSFIVVSDDMELARRLIPKSPNVFFAEGPRSPEMDLNIMIKARGVITGNSTFGWWGAYLNPNGVVVAPKAWHRRDAAIDPVLSDIYPGSWTIL